MAILNKKLHIKHDNDQVDFELATTSEETGCDKNLSLLVEDLTVYSGLDEDTSVSNFKVKIEKTYAVRKSTAPQMVPGSQEYTTPGTYTFTAPYTGEYQIEVAGAGGGSSGTLNNFGGIGGTGELIVSIINLTKDTVYSVVVGAGGTVGKITDSYGTPPSDVRWVVSSGANGGNSSFDTLVAKGGGGGIGGEIRRYYGNGMTSGIANGTSYTGGGAGGGLGSAGSPGWVKISWGN